MSKSRHKPTRKAVSKARRPKSHKSTSARPSAKRTAAAKAEAGRLRFRRRGLVGLAAGLVIATGLGYLAFKTAGHGPVIARLARDSRTIGLPPKASSPPLARSKPTAVPVVAATATLAPSPSPQVERGIDVPILMYHDTPADFAAQLDSLQNKGYSVVTMAQVYAGLHGGGLPAKPVAITFDDGYADQTVAFEALSARHMPATFYIINGGAASRWCIGAGRHYNDPLQPSGGCGDQYLTWDQLRTYDRSGLITIGAHTVDHISLAAADVDTQQREISDSKVGIEQELGHKIYDFAYPSGAYSDKTVNLVKAAGLRTAVTTDPGTYQPVGSELTLKRVREASALP